MCLQKELKVEHGDERSVSIETVPYPLLRSLNLKLEDCKEIRFLSRFMKKISLPKYVHVNLQNNPDWKPPAVLFCGLRLCCTTD